MPTCCRRSSGWVTCIAGMTPILLCENHSPEFLVQRDARRRARSAAVRRGGRRDAISAVDRVNRKRRGAAESRTARCSPSSRARAAAAGRRSSRPTSPTRSRPRSTSASSSSTSTCSGATRCSSSPTSSPRSRWPTSRRRSTGSTRPTSPRASSSAHPNLGVLAAPEDPVHALDVKPEHIDVLMRIARSHFDFVILDVGRALDAVTVRALDYADMIFPVLQLTLPFIRDGKRLLAAFRSLDYPAPEDPAGREPLREGRRHLAAGHGAGAGRQGVPHVPERLRPRSPTSINQGVPVVEARARQRDRQGSLREFAHELVASPAKEPGSWFARMMRSGVKAARGSGSTSMSLRERLGHATRSGRAAAIRREGECRRRQPGLQRPEDSGSTTNLLDRIDLERMQRLEPARAARRDRSAGRADARRGGASRSTRASARASSARSRTRCSGWGRSSRCSPTRRSPTSWSTPTARSTSSGAASSS